MFGTDGQRNAAHGSDSAASAAREVRFYFPGLIQEPLADDADARRYIQQHLEPTLLKALTVRAGSPIAHVTDGQ